VRGAKETFGKQSNEIWRSFLPPVRLFLIQFAGAEFFLSHMPRMNYVGNFAARFALFAHGKATVKGKKESFVFPLNRSAVEIKHRRVFTVRL
jgi:hypothetical protein